MNHTGIVARLMKSKVGLFFNQNDLQFRMIFLQLIKGSGSHDSSADDRDVKCIFQYFSLEDEIIFCRKKSAIESKIKCS